MVKQSIVNIYLKPTLLRGWIIIKETKKCLVVRKVFKNRLGDPYYVSKKTIVKIKHMR